MRRISSWWEKVFIIPKSNMWRTVWLAIAVIIGIPSAWEIVEIHKGLAMGYSPRITDYIALISIPILFVLWLFRTHDVREQIEKTQENINSGLYSKGIELLSNESHISRTNGLLIMSIVRRRGLFKEEIDLTTSAGLYLEDVNLSKANLANMNLEKVQLRRADLVSADLRETNLVSADLREALLIDANLANANLKDVNLTNANLIAADLTNAYLWEANLTNANLTVAYLANAILARVDLTTAKLKGAKYNNKTVFPKGFDPKEHDMIKEK